MIKQTFYNLDGYIGYKWWENQKTDFESLKENIINIFSLLLTKSYYFILTDYKSRLKTLTFNIADDEDSKKNGFFVDRRNEKEFKEFVENKLLEISDNNTDIQLIALSSLIVATADFEYYYDALNYKLLRKGT